jgi:hypothetical protein
MSDPREIAAKLSPAHFAALERRFEWGDPAEQDQGEAELYAFGLWRLERVTRKKPNGKKGWTFKNVVTPLGCEVLAVRAALQEGVK